MIASEHPRNRAPRWRALVTLVAIVGLFGSSSLAVLALEGTPAAPPTEVATEAPAEVSTQVVTEVPTEIATEAPTQVATETATAVATEVPAARGAPMTSMASTDETPIPPNTDTLAATSSTELVSLEPGESQQYTFTHTVTTPRTGTAIHAELRHADGSLASGWGLSAQAGGGEWAGGSGVVDVTEWGTLVPDTAFTLSLIVTAPVEVTAEQTVSLWISSTASTARGEVETGVEATGPLATIIVVPPPPPADPNSLACDVPEGTGIAPGEPAELPCTYTVNDPAAEASVTAAFSTVPGDGWLLAINDGPAGESAIWAPAEGTTDGNLIVRVTAPADAEADQQATITVTAAGESAPAENWTVTVAEPEPDSMQPAARMMVVEGNLDCIQTSSADVVTYDADPQEGVNFVRFTCSDIADTSTVTLTGLTSGWQYRVNDEPTWKGSSGTYSGQTGYTIDLAPGSDAASWEGSVTVTVGTDSATLYAYNSTTGAACNPTASINGEQGEGLKFADSKWENGSWTPVDGSVQISFTKGDSCGNFPTNWAVHVSVSNMSRTDGDKTGEIPSSAIRYTSGTVGSGESGLTASAGPMPVGNSTIATGDSTYTSGNLSATFTLSPPDTTPPGHYQGTITITTSASGD